MSFIVLFFSFLCFLLDSGFRGWQGELLHWSSPATEGDQPHLFPCLYIFIITLQDSSAEVNFIGLVFVCVCVIRDSGHWQPCFGVRAGSWIPEKYLSNYLMIAGRIHISSTTFISCEKSTCLQHLDTNTVIMTVLLN